MSSLIYFTEQELALVATDTLATSDNDMKTPVLFTTKAFALPHLRMIIAGTGWYNIITQWMMHVNINPFFDIDSLDEKTPSILRHIHTATVRSNYRISQSPSCTIYHFGFSRTDNLIHSYAYRSEKNFASERLPQVVQGVKPECSFASNCNLIEQIPSMMREQRQIQRSKPLKDRVIIGSEMQVLVLDKSGYRIEVIDKFEDYSSDENIIFPNKK